VWEYWNPHRTGKKDELVGRIFDMVRISPDFPMDWLEEPAREGTQQPAAAPKAD